MTLKELIPILATVAGIVVSVISWVASGFPPLATKSYVDANRTYIDGLYWQLACRQYRNQIHLDRTDLFQWQQNTKPFSQNIQDQIDILNNDIAYLNGQIAQNCN